MRYFGGNSELFLIQEGVDVPDRMGDGFSPSRSRRSGEVRIPQDREIRFHGTDVKPPSFGGSLILYAVSSIVRLMIGHDCCFQVQRSCAVRVLDSSKDFGSRAGLVEEPKNGSAN